MKLLLTRPLEDSAPLADLLASKGFETVTEPLITIKFVSDGKQRLEKSALATAKALLVTSANGLRAFCAFSDRRDLLVMAVGDASARLAREEGFVKVESAAGDVESLSLLVASTLKPADGPLVHVAGSHLAGDLKTLLETGGYTYERVVLYDSVQADGFSESLQASLKADDIAGVLLYSPRTAEAFTSLLKKARLGPSRKSMTAYCLSEAVMKKIKDPAWKDVLVAAQPDQESLLKLLPEYSTVTSSEEKKMAEESKTESKPKSTVPSTSSRKVDTKAEQPKETTKASPAKAEPAKKGASKPQPQPQPGAKSQAQGAAQKKSSFFPKAVAASVVILAAGGGGAFLTKDAWMPAATPYIPPALTGDYVDPNLAALKDRVARLESAPGGGESSVLSDLESQRAAQQREMTALLDRVNTLETALGDVKKLITAIEPPGEAQSQSSSLQALRERLADLEASQGSGGNPELGQSVAELLDRVGRLEESGGQTEVRIDDGRALLSAIGNLREALRGSGSYSAELQTVRTLGAGDEQLLGYLEGLQGAAGEGVPTLSGLRNDFYDVTNKAIRAAAVPETGNWIQQTVANVTSLVTVRRAGENLDGNTAPAVVARAEAALEAGDLSTTVAELMALSGLSFQSVVPWIEQANTRLETERALAALHARALALVTDAGQS